MPHTRSNRPAGSRAKWGAVILLALVFVYLMSRSGSKEQAATAPANASASPGPPSPAITAKSTPRATRPLQPTTIEKVLSFNPFEFDGRSIIPGTPNAAPAAPLQPAVVARKPPKPPDATKQLRKSVSGKVADIIFESPRGRSARVGDRIIREGRPYGPGAVVRRIHKDNVILQAQPGK